MNDSRSQRSPRCQDFCVEEWGADSCDAFGVPCLDAKGMGLVQSPERDDDGFLLDEYGNPYGWCNSCGEEAAAGSECCDDGEVVPDA